MVEGRGIKASRTRVFVVAVEVLGGGNVKGGC